MTKNEKVIILGKSGSGKDFLMRKLTDKGLKPCLKWTTRPQRKFEEQGVTYNFVDNFEFLQSINENKFLTHQEFDVTPNDSDPEKWYYGITTNEFESSQVMIMTPGEFEDITEEQRKCCFVVYLDIDTSDEHYLTNLSWSPDEKFVFLAEVNRDQNHMWYTMYDASTGKLVKTLFEEKNDRWVEPENTAVFLPNSNTEYLWLSERDGYMNLYLYDINNKYEKQLTQFSWVLKQIIGFDKSGKNVIVSGTGKDGRETKAFKINLKNGRFETLTEEPGVHSVQLSPNGNYIIDSYSSIDVPRVVKRKSLKNGKEATIYTSENPIEGYQLGTTEFVSIKANDGVDMYGRIIKPANFDANKKYPVLIYVYGGTHAQMVTNSWLAGSNLWMQWMAAEQDYIVFTLDNHGSANRGFAFESIIHRQAGEVEMEDQLLGVDYLKSLPYVDGNRLAVHGWSYGGFMANSLMLRHPGVFTTAVAGGPVTDWKYYEIMYGERYMDRWQDNEEGFEKSRVHNYVENLDGKLLEIIGSVDPVVVPQHTMSLLKAFVDAKKQVDFLSYPMHPHNVRGLDRAHLMKKVLDYVILNNQ